MIHRELNVLKKLKPVCCMKVEIDASYHEDTQQKSQGHMGTRYSPETL